MINKIKVIFILMLMSYAAISGAEASLYVAKIKNTMGAAPATNDNVGTTEIFFELAINSTSSIYKLVLLQGYPFSADGWEGVGETVNYDFKYRGSPYIKLLEDMENALIHNQKIRIELTDNGSGGGSGLCTNVRYCMELNPGSAEWITYKVQY